jgi:glycosyltransferase involved in cell wall biosynthesis
VNWYRAPGEGWTKVFNYVVGIVHTNYIEYASTHFHGLWTAPAIQVMSSAMVRAYCHKVIKLSGVLQTYAPEKETIQNVHGVRQDFIQEGIRRGALSSNNVNTLPLEEESGGQVYYIGKILWAKGFDLMLELQKFYHECTGNYFAIDIIGGGPDLDEIKRAFYGRGHNSTTTFSTKTTAANKKRKLGYIGSSSLEFDIPKSLYELRKKPIPAKFLGPLDHAALGKKYKVFVNPSVSEVLCTTTFEALAMGKFAIIPVHESNKFFLRFPNCLGYRNKWEFAASLRWALTHEPEPLTAELANEFTWEAATDRLIQSAAITRKEAHEREKLGTAKLDERIAFFHNELGKGTRGDTLRKVLGGGPIASQARYEMLKQGIILDEVEENNGGVSIAEKFKTSSFVQAIKSSFSTNIQPRYSAS